MEKYKINDKVYVRGKIGTISATKHDSKVSKRTSPIDIGEGLRFPKNDNEYIVKFKNNKKTPSDFDYIYEEIKEIEIKNKLKNE